MVQRRGGAHAGRAKTTFEALGQGVVGGDRELPGMKGGGQTDERDASRSDFA